ncbi:MAG: riboflavin synthase [Candidatus Omnitrophica bacterium]|nr:riboflavin synthase [Candidatus Omnitrophota bacterium]MDE2221851.1 riboflavin synthase [Candidatus Omnitrophota bacterium]
MFTGIVEHQGIVKKIETKKNLLVFSIDLGPLAPKVRLGDSVAIDGVCLTARSKKAKTAAFDLMKETIEKTALRDLKAGDSVNLELALRADQRLGGHFVTGHVDEVAVIKRIDEELNWVAVTLSVSRANRKYIVPKGSVTVNGVSLTVGWVGKDRFQVYLIPYTLQVTNLGEKKAGDCVNIETDILAKYLFNKKGG